MSHASIKNGETPVAEADVDAIVKDRLQELGIADWFAEAWRLTDGTVSHIFEPLVASDEKLSALRKQLK